MLERGRAVRKLLVALEGELTARVIAARRADVRWFVSHLNYSSTVH